MTLAMLAADGHVHSTFSDGAGTISENVRAAEAAGLRGLTCVDHVRVDTPWVAEFVDAVRGVQRDTAVELMAGVEAKLLGLDGTLDLPADHALADIVMIADHQFPSEQGPLLPDAVKALLASGEISEREVVRDLASATASAVSSQPNSCVVHFGSLLPKLGLSSSSWSADDIDLVSHALLANGAFLELSERWRCPSAEIANEFHQRGVQLVCGTDAHRPQDIGVFNYVEDVVSKLGLR